MDEYLAAGEMAGAALVIRRQGDVILRDTWGYADIQQKKKVEFNTLFRLASLTKPVTAVGVLKLIDQGKIDLDDELASFLPDFSDMQVVSDRRYVSFAAVKNPFTLLTFRQSKVKTVSADRPITIRDLLTHSSGLEMGIVGYLLMLRMKYRGDNLESRVYRYARQPLDFQPGTATGYSPLAGFDVLARVIEVVSGQPFADYMQQEIFEPLCMQDTTFHPDIDQQQRIPRLYKTVHGQHKDVTGSRADINAIGRIGPGYSSGSAGLYSTLDDYDRFGQMLANQGELDGFRLLSPEMVHKIYTETAYQHLETDPGRVWGLGMLIRQEQEKTGTRITPDTYGWSGAFGTHFFISPRDGLEVVLMMNRSDIGGAASPIAKRLEELVFE